MYYVKLLFIYLFISVLTFDSAKNMNIANFFGPKMGNYSYKWPFLV